MERAGATLLNTRGQARGYRNLAESVGDAIIVRCALELRQGSLKLLPRRQAFLGRGT